MKVSKRAVAVVLGGAWLLGFGAIAGAGCVLNGIEHSAMPGEGRQ